MSETIFKTKEIKSGTDLVKIQNELLTLAAAHPERKYFHVDTGETDQETGKPIYKGYEKRKYVKQ